MIKVFDKVFKLDTKNTSYILRVGKFGHLLNDYYGNYIPDEGELLFAKEKHALPSGTQTIYEDEEDSAFSLDEFSLEVSTFGKGDYKEPSIIIKGRDGYILDLKYESYQIREFIPNKSLPYPKGKSDELIVTLYDEISKIYAKLHYLVFEECDVILRNVELVSTEDEIIIKKCASMQFDLVDQDYSILSLYGSWACEANKEIIKVPHGIYYIDSKTGNSSNRHNPFFALFQDGSGYNYGNCYMFNLMYSGEHQELIERTTFDKLHVQCGVNPYLFEYPLKKDEHFFTPFAVLTFSDKGLNGASQHMHDFIREHVIPHKDVLPPIIINNWEATYAKFKENKLHNIIRDASHLGIETFALDDGWFSNRDDDTKGLGDYNLNKKKLPHGLNKMSQYANKKGLKFGLWFEPEMINEDSHLYKLHPDWVLRSNLRKPSKGRHQLVLDLTKNEVCQYIIDNLSKIIKENNICYIKWDMNRNMSDVVEAGRYIYDYYLGFYKILENLTSLYPDVYMEGCASGGNRFDLGILSYFSQIWASDDTDGLQRNIIQSGFALAYPLRCISNHVSAHISHQPIRHTPLSTRINVSMFGAFGFEMDLSTLTPIEKKQVEYDIEFYKKHREIFIFGDFYQLKWLDKDGYSLWLVVSKDKNTAILGYFNGLQKMNPKIGEIKLFGLDEDSKYSFSVKYQVNDLKTFGGLINMILPFHVNERGFLVNTVSKYKGIDIEKEEYIISGKALNSGALKLNQQWQGTGIGDGVRVLADFGSRIYLIKKI